MMNCTVTHIDTCLGCYLTDHHNRDGELLLGVSVYGDTTNKEVLEALEHELNSADYGLPDWFDDDACRAAMADEIASDDKPFDSSLDMACDEDDCGEPCQAWFLVEYSREVEVFELTAHEYAASRDYQDEQHEFMQRNEFKLAGMNSRDREAMLDAMVSELGIRGGWFYECDGMLFGPYDTADEAEKASRE